MITVEQFPWSARWGGGRTADVYHAEHGSPLDCFQVEGWDWQTSRSAGTREDVARGLEEWIAEQGPTYLRELPYLP